MSHLECCGPIRATSQYAMKADPEKPLYRTCRTNQSAACAPSDDARRNGLDLFGDLDRVQRSAFQQIIRNNPHVERTIM